MAFNTYAPFLFHSWFQCYPPRHDSSLRLFGYFKYICRPPGCAWSISHISHWAETSLGLHVAINHSHCCQVLIMEGSVQPNPACRPFMTLSQLDSVRWNCPLVENHIKSKKKKKFNQAEQNRLGGPGKGKVKQKLKSVFGRRGIMFN